MSIQLRGNDTSVFNNDVQFTSQNSDQLAGFRNQIINGDFRVWQRGESNPDVTAVTNYFIADRWSIRSTVDSGGTVGYAKTTNATSNVLEMTYTGLTSYTFIVQKIEAQNVRAFQGGRLTVSLSTDAAGPSVTIVGVVNGAESILQNRATLISEGGSRWSFSFDLPASSVGTGATDSLNVFIYPNNGTNVQPDGKVTFWDIQLEPGPVATPFEHRPITVEQFLCYRYYQESSFNRIMFEGNSSTSQAQMFAAANGDQRTSSPTVRSRAGNTYVYTNGDRHEGSNEDNTQRSIVGGGISSGRARLIINRISASTTQNIQIVGGTSDDYWFTFDAEL